MRCSSLRWLEHLPYFSEILPERHLPPGPALSYLGTLVLGEGELSKSRAVSSPQDGPEDLEKGRLPSHTEEGTLRQLRVLADTSLFAGAVGGGSCVQTVAKKPVVKHQGKTVSTIRSFLEKFT